MPNIPLLPTLNQGQVTPGDKGKWKTELGTSLLSNVSKGIKTGSGLVEINSVPSPWSRALQYITALLSEDYPGRSWLLNQYRGMLATLALSDILHLPVTAKPVSLDRDLNGEQKMDWYDLQESLASLLPHNDLSLYRPIEGQANVWSNVFVFSLGEHVIGFSSPATLVVPACNLNSSLSGEPRWIQDGFFLNPLNDLSAYEAKSLLAWLVNLQSHIPSNGPNQKLRNQLDGFLNKFIGELSHRAGTFREYKLSSNRFGNADLEPELLKNLYPIGIDDKVSQSYVKVVAESGKNPMNNLYIYDSARLHKSFNLPNEQVPVIGALTLATFTVDRGRVIAPNAEFLPPAEIFLPNLYYFKQENVLPGNWLAKAFADYKYSIVLPINPVLLDYFSSQKLKDMISFQVGEREGRKSLRISISIPLSGSGNPVIFTHYKEFYFLPDYELKIEDIPTIALWPNVYDQRSDIPQPRGRCWSKYFLFVENDTNENDVAFTLTFDSPAYNSKLRKPTASPTTRNNQINTAVRAAEVSQPHGIRPVMSPSYTTAKGSNVTYVELDFYPDVLITQRPAVGVIGIIPIERPQTYGQGATFTIGVDFGTSLTNVAINTSIDDPTVVVPDDLGSFLLPLTSLSDNTKLNDLLDHFIPLEFPRSALFKTPPIPTIVTIEGSGLDQKQDKVYDPIHHVRIYHATSGSVGILNKASILANLKWESIEYVVPFLKQLTFLLTAYAHCNGAASIQWKVSYPSAFSDGEKDRYLENWDEVIPWLACTGKEHIFDRNRDVLTESRACAEFFKSYLPSQELQNACTVDIGGGTTDLAFLSEGVIKHQVSFRFAARDIFHRLINPNAQVINQSFTDFIFGPEYSLSQRIVSANKDSELDLWMREKSNDFLSSIPYRKSYNNPVAIQFRTLLTFALGGLFFYIGMLNKYLADDAKLGTTGNVVSLFIGGNGSNFFRWLDSSGSFSNNTSAYKLLEGILNSASGLNTSTYGIKLSEKPKAEACIGLAGHISMINIGETNQSGADTADRSLGGPYLGLPCRIYGNLDEEGLDPVAKEFSSNERLQLPDGWDKIPNSIQITDLSLLDTYIQLFNSLTRRVENFSPLTTKANGATVILRELSANQRQRLQDTISSYFRAKLRIAQGNPTLGFEREPMFIVAFKCLLIVLAEDLAVN